MAGVIWEWIGTLIVIIIFTIFPAYLLWNEYNMAVALAFSSISATLLSTFWNTNKLTHKKK